MSREKSRRSSKSKKSRKNRRQKKSQASSLKSQTSLEEIKRRNKYQILTLIQFHVHQAQVHDQKALVMEEHTDYGWEKEKRYGGKGKNKRGKEQVLGGSHQLDETVSTAINLTIVTLLTKVAKVLQVTVEHTRDGWSLKKKELGTKGRTVSAKYS